jgi:uncharacterized protein YdhG (YjbR/CyaY superfamily)
MKKQALASINQYIQSFPKQVQEELSATGGLVKEAAPGAREKISYQMPRFFLNGDLGNFAAHTSHIGFYPGSSKNVFSRFKKELEDYQTGKGSTQFPLEQELPLELIRKIVQFRIDESNNKRKKWDRDEMSSVGFKPTTWVMAFKQEHANGYLDRPARESASQKRGIANWNCSETSSRRSERRLCPARLLRHMASAIGSKR